MIKYQKLPENIHQLLPKASDYLKLHPKVRFAYLFGGLVKGTPQPLSTFLPISLDILKTLTLYL
jgi:predicted nucleotidyltransferase